MVDRTPAETVRLFDDAFNRHDLEALADLITDDCVFEDTTPPDGRRHVGRRAVLEACSELLAGGSHVHFDIEELVTAGDRVFVLWRYSWGAGHVRGLMSCASAITELRRPSPTSKARSTFHCGFRRAEGSERAARGRVANPAGRPVPGPLSLVHRSLIRPGYCPQVGRLLRASHWAELIAHLHW